MPYIKQEDRQALQTRPPETAGELNYTITTIIEDYLQKGKNYQNINEVIGVLECAKLELYRRVASPYEDLKITENGDVYND